MTKFLLMALLVIAPDSDARSDVGVGGIELSEPFVLQGKVVKVIDGDTIDLLNEVDTSMSRGRAAPSTNRVRLANIDAPETKQAFGRRSRENLARLVAGARVTANCLSREHRREVEEARQRAVCTVTLAPGPGQAAGKSLDVNAQQIRDGFAWYAAGFVWQQSVEVRQGYKEAQDSARIARRGLWVDLGSAVPPIAPWRFRQLSQSSISRPGSISEIR